MVRIIHQKDQYERHITEWWILDGVSYHQGQALKKIGFTWIKGCPGCWQAPDRNALAPLIDNGCEVVKVGTGHQDTIG